MPLLIPEGSVIAYLIRFCCYSITWARECCGQLMAVCVHRRLCSRPYLRACVLQLLCQLRMVCFHQWQTRQRKHLCRLREVGVQVTFITI